MKHIVDVRDKNSESDLIVIGANVWERTTGDERAKAIRKYAADNGITYDLIVASNDSATQWGVRGIPTVFVFDSNGNVVYNGHPAQDAFRKAVAEQVAALQAAKADRLRTAIESVKIEVTIVHGKGKFAALKKTVSDTISVGAASFKELKQAEVFHALVKAAAALGEKSEPSKDAENIHLFIRESGKSLLPKSMKSPVDQGPSVDALIEKLADEDPDVRDEAALALKKIGAPALEKLRKAAESTNAETSSRAKEIITSIERSAVGTGGVCHMYSCPAKTAPAEIERLYKWCKENIEQK